MESTTKRKWPQDTLWPQKDTKQLQRNTKYPKRDIFNTNKWQNDQNMT